MSPIIDELSRTQVLSYHYIYVLANVTFVCVCVSVCV